MTVELGDVTFDPVESSDFSLSIEGTRGTGKSNTLAVMLEDLSDTNYPTLIVERIGALLPVRVADESIIVVGGEDTQQVDLVVPKDDLRNVGDWVLDHGLKVLVDISTYADYESEQSHVHDAAAAAVKSLMNRAEQKYKNPGETRTKCLLLIDEGDYLAPKTNAPTPSQKGEYVKQCRGHIVRAATEGGNFGVSPVVAYQRRAYIANGVLNLCTNWIVHGLESDDLSRAAKSLRVSEDRLDGLDTGEIVAKGDIITDNEVVGPTQVRKRNTPDPREDTFEVPETPPEVERVIETIQDDIGAPSDEDADTPAESGVESDADAERVQELQAKVEHLQSELEDARAGADDEMQERVDTLTERVDELREERDSLRDELQAREDTVDDLQARVAELEALEDSVDEAAQRLYDALDALGRGDPEAGGMNEELSRLRQRVEELEAENERLRTQTQEGGDVDVSLDGEAYIDFIERDPVQEAIADAKEDSTASPRYVEGVIATIIDEGEPVSYDEVAQRLDVATTDNISKAASTLEAKGVVEKTTEGTNGRVHVDLNVGGIEEIVARRKKQERTQEVMEKIKG